MLGGRGSEGDINFWGNTLRPHPLTGSVRIADGAGGVGAATHDLAEIESYLRGQVHIFIDDAPPNNALTIVRFEAPEAGCYKLHMRLENRILAGVIERGRNVFFIVCTDTWPVSRPLMKAFYLQVRKRLAWTRVLV